MPVEADDESQSHRGLARGDGDDEKEEGGGLNVAIAEPPITPVLRSNPPWLWLILGGVLAVMISLGSAVALDYMDSSLRTPSEVFSELKIPVLAAVPVENAGYHKNRNGNGNGGKHIREDEFQGLFAQRR